MRNRGPFQSGTLYNQPLHYLVYTDDIAFLGRRRQDVARAFTEMKDAAHNTCLHLNDSKTKLMTMDRNKNNLENLEIDGTVFEEVKASKYLGSRVTNDNSTMEEMKERISCGNKCYFSLQITKSRSISRDDFTKLLSRTRKIAEEENFQFVGVRNTYMG